MDKNPDLQSAIMSYSNQLQRSVQFGIFVNLLATMVPYVVLTGKTTDCQSAKPNLKHINTGTVTAASIFRSNC